MNPDGIDLDEAEYIRAMMDEDELSWHSLCESLGEKAWPVAAPTTATATAKEHAMKLSDAFPSKWLKADDLQGKSVKVMIDEVRQEEVGQGSDTELKLVAYFVGKQKGCILNKTNANAIGSKHGDDTDKWSGAEVELYPEMVTFQGKTGPAIRIRIPVPAAIEGDEPPF